MAGRHPRAVFLACSALLTLSLTPAAFAQSAENGEIAESASTDASGDADGATKLKKIVLDSGAAKQGVADTPLASETTAKQLTDNQIDTIDEFGRSLEPGVAFVRENGSINLRGLEGGRVLTTIDGIRIPFLDDGVRGARGGINSFDFNSLSTVDVVRGADSSRAGSGALGGAVVLQTLEPEDLIGEGNTWGGVFKLVYDTTDRSIGGSAAVAKQVDNTAILFEGGYRAGHERDNNGDIDSYGGERTKANPADFDQYNFLAKVKQYTDEGHTFGLTAERFDLNKNIDLKSEQTPGLNFRPGYWDGTEILKRDRVSANYAFEALDDDALFDRANATIFWQKQIRSSDKYGYRFNSVVGDYSRRGDTEENGVGAFGSVEKYFNTGWLEHRLTIGGEVSLSKVTQYSSGVDNCDEAWHPSCAFLHTNQSDMPDTDSAQFGIYIDDQIAFGDTGFSLTPGLRFDWFEHSPQETQSYLDNPNSNGEIPPTNTGHRFSPKLLANYEAAPGVEIFGQWSMAFRAPSSTELYQNYGGTGTYLTLGDPYLKPETSNGFELGAILGDEDFGGKITGFYNRYRNFIDVAPLPDDQQDPENYPMGISQYFNRERVRIFGAEASAYKVFDNGFHARGSITYANGKDLNTGEYLRSVAPLKAVASAGYATETWGTDLTWIGVAAAKDDNNPSTIDAPGYGIFDLTAWWEPEQYQGMRLQAGIYNIFDKVYFDALNVRKVQVIPGSTTPPPGFYAEPGRSFKVTLTQRF